LPSQSFLDGLPIFYCYWLFHRASARLAPRREATAADLQEGQVALALAERAARLGSQSRAV